jgi:CRP-like cAMP-binding protein/Fe-S-cluster-containing hydrogenase component 2
MGFKLRVSAGPRAGETTELLKGRTYVIGRGKDADLRFPEDPYMSRAHTEVAPDGDGWCVRNKSQHQTFVAGVPIPTQKRLNPSDVLMVGGTLLVFESDRPANAPFPASPAPAGAAAAKPADGQGAAAPMTPAAAKTPESADESSEISGTLPVVFLPGDSKELEAEELANFALFAGIPAKTIEGSIIKRHKINDQPPIWLRKYAPGEIVCKEGEYGSTAYFITKGVVFIGISKPQDEEAKSGARQALTKLIKTFTMSGADEEDDEEKARFIPVDAPVHLPYDKPVAELKEGDLFGEMSCMSFYPRSATVVAGPEGAEVLELLRSVLDFIRSNAKAGYKERIEKTYRERTLDHALRSVPLFAGLPTTFVDVLKPHIAMVDFGPDTFICKEGDPADAFYLVRVGFVKVSQKRAGGDVVLQYLGPGQYFGEIGLIEGGKRTASCTALDHVELIKINKKDFDNLLTTFPDLMKKLKKSVTERLGQQRKLAETPGELPLSLLAEKGVMNAQNLLVIDLEKCTRCDECVRACADQHGGLTRLVRDGLRLDKYLIATACRACADPVCMIGCPVGSIRRRNSLEILIEDWCIGCGKCAQQCPYGNITMHPFTKLQKVEVEENGKKTHKRELAIVNSGKGKAVSCDLCGGGMEPRCVYACPHDAARRGHPFTIFSSTLPGRG